LGQQRLSAAMMLSDDTTTSSSGSASSLVQMESSITCRATSLQSPPPALSNLTFRTKRREEAAGVAEREIGTMTP
jgi:hypothetical protein